MDLRRLAPPFAGSLSHLERQVRACLLVQNLAFLAANFQILGIGLQHGSPVTRSSLTTSTTSFSTLLPYTASGDSPSYVAIGVSSLNLGSGYILTRPVYQFLSLPFSWDSI